jgi:hypothetical protein
MCYTAWISLNIGLYKVYCFKLTNFVAPEPEGSSPHSQQPANDPYPEPGESTPQPPNNPPKAHFDPILPSTPRSSEWSLSFGAFPPKDTPSKHALMKLYILIRF